jgi:hypothetical protein
MFPPISFIEKLKCNCFCAPRTIEYGERDSSMHNTMTRTTNNRRPASLDIQTEALKKNYITSKRIIEMGANHKLQILPVMRGKEILDLYPVTDQVHLWNTFVVGKKMNYIVANVNDLNIGVEDPKYLLNTTADNLMDDDIKTFFEHIWKETLGGVDLQFFMIKSGKTFFVNTYCLQNGNQETIGGLCFIRNVQTLPYFMVDEDDGMTIIETQKTLSS